MDKRAWRCATVYLPLVVVLTLLAPEARGQDDDEKHVEAIYAASPTSTDTARFSHFPVPLVYAEWEAEVMERFGRMAIAATNRHLYQDLPPIKAEDEGVPSNPAIEKLFSEGETHAAEILLAALGADPARPQWSLIAALARVPGDAPVEALVRIAAADPDPTDRAFAVKDLARRGGPKAKKALRAALLDDHQSVRLLAAQGLGALGDGLGDMALLTPIRPENPFQLLFLEKALGRVIPGADVWEFIRLGWRDRYEKVKTAKPALVNAYRNRVVDSRDRPFGAMMTWLLGTEGQAARALAALEDVLLSQGRRPESLNSPEFRLRTVIIQALRQSSDARGQLLAALLAKHLADFSEEKAPLVIALAYTFESCRVPDVVPHLARIRDLKTANPDVYMAAGAGLAGQKSEEAFPSLVHVLGLGKEPFATVAVRHLERLTGLETPGKPRDVGALGNLGLPQDPLDVGRAHRFWKEWYEATQGRLVLDPATGRFTAVPPEPADLRANHVLWDGATSEERRRAAEELGSTLDAFALKGLESFADGGVKHEVAIYRHTATGMEFVFVPGGRYVIGSAKDEPGRYPEEVRHEVALSPFLIGRTEVTQAVWEKAMGANPSESKGADRPVDTVSWDAADAFVRKVGLALPTEAQWEAACRAGTSTAYSFGADARALTEYAWFERNSGGESHPVAAKRPNGLGLYDMHGNVIEWVADGYARYPESGAPDPRIPPRQMCVVRGGSFVDEPAGCRSSFRFGLPRSAAYSMNGLRAAFPIGP